MLPIFSGVLKPQIIPTDPLANVIYKVSGSTCGLRAEFGRYMDTDGTYVVVYGENTNTDEKNIYVFDALTGVELYSIAPINVATKNVFGQLLAISDGIIVSSMFYSPTDTYVTYGWDAETGNLLYTKIGAKAQTPNYIDAKNGKFLMGHRGRFTNPNFNSGNPYIAMYDISTGNQLWKQDTDFIYRGIISDSYLVLSMAVNTVESPSVIARSSALTNLDGTFIEIMNDPTPAGLKDNSAFGASDLFIDEDNNNIYVADTRFVLPNGDKGYLRRFDLTTRDFIDSINPLNEDYPTTAFPASIDINSNALASGGDDVIFLLDPITHVELGVIDTVNLFGLGKVVKWLDSTHLLATANYSGLSTQGELILYEVIFP